MAEIAEDVGGLARKYWLLSVVLLVVVVSFFAGIGPFERAPGEAPSIPRPGEPKEPEPGPVIGGNAALEFTLINRVTSGAITSATSEVDICKADDNGVFDLLGFKRTVTVNSDPEYSSSKYNPGDKLLLHALSDTDPAAGSGTGTDHYDVTYYLEVGDGNPIYEVTEGILSGSAGKYKITGNGVRVGECVWSEGDTNYWFLGPLGVYPRIDVSSLDFSVDMGSTSLSSVTDGTTFDTTAGSSDYSMTQDVQDLDIKLDADTTDLCYALPQFTLTGTGDIEVRKAVIVMSTTMTMIDDSDLSEDGWVKINDGTLTSEKAYYKVLPSYVPTSGDDWSDTIELTVDASGAASSTDYTFKLWLNDYQIPSRLKEGTSYSSVPSANGFFNEYGIDAVIFDQVYTTSSGAGATQCLTFVLTSDA